MRTELQSDAAATPTTYLLSQQANPDKLTNINGDLAEAKEHKPDLSASTFNEYLSRFNQTSVHKTLEQYVDNDYQKRYPSPFIVDTFVQDWHHKALPNTVHARWNFRIRIVRMLGVISVAVILLIITSLYQVRTAAIIGLGLLTMFTIYFCIILSYVFCMPDKDTLYRVYSISHRPQGWLSLNSGYIQLLYKNESIQSISELSAINGGVTKTMLNTLGAYTWAGIAIHFAGEIYYNSCIFQWDIVDVLEFVGGTGLLMISIFELDPFRPGMRFMHNFGAAIGGGTIAGYVIQQYYIGTKFWFAVVIAIVAGTGFILWQLSGIATDLAQSKCKAQYSPTFEKKVKLANKEKREVRISKLQWFIPSCFKGRDVNTYSRMNIAFEAVFLYSGALCLCLWMFDYNQSCDIGCAGYYDDDILSKCNPWYLL